MNLSQLADRLPDLLGDALLSVSVEFGEVTCLINAAHIKEVCTKLRDDPSARFETLIDLCGVDYVAWGNMDGDTSDPADSVSAAHPSAGAKWQGARFVVVYHLLSFAHNLRVRVRAELDDEPPTIESVIDVWPGANWFEREAFDLLGILFTGHPDLRRLLTDYGFIGHPFRKDFPLSGQVEMRYDEEQGRVIYQPVTIEERVLVPRIIRR